MKFAFLVPWKVISYITSCLLRLFLLCSSDGFTDEGCHVVTSRGNSGETVCSCNHLTQFAVLFDYNDGAKVINYKWFSSSTGDTSKYIELIRVSLFSFLCCVTQLSEQEETVLKIITYVGLSFSIIGILLTSALYFFLT